MSETTYTLIGAVAFLGGAALLARGASRQVRRIKRFSRCLYLVAQARLDLKYGCERMRRARWIAAGERCAWQ